MSTLTDAQRRRARAIAHQATRVAARGDWHPEGIAQQAAFHARPEPMPARIAYAVRMAAAVLTGRHITRLADAFPPYPRTGGTP